MEYAAALHARLGRLGRALTLYDALLVQSPERTSALLAAGALREANEQADSTLLDAGVGSALLSVSYLRRASLHRPADEALLGRIVSLLHPCPEQDPFPTRPTASLPSHPPLAPPCAPLGEPAAFVRRRA